MHAKQQVISGLAMLFLACGNRDTATPRTEDPISQWLGTWNFMEYNEHGKLVRLRDADHDDYYEPHFEDNIKFKSDGTWLRAWEYTWKEGGGKIIGKEIGIYRVLENRFFLEVTFDSEGGSSWKEEGSWDRRDDVLRLFWDRDFDDTWILRKL